MLTMALGIFSGLLEMTAEETLIQRPLLKAFLKPLEPFLKTKNLVELSVNKPQEVGLEIAGIGYHFVAAPELTDRYWTSLCHILANGNGMMFDPIRQPKVSTYLPGGHRFEAMIGKNVRSELSVSIRLKRQIVLPLRAFGLKGAIQERLINLVKRGANMIVSGGTSSGKTTFLNQLIPYIPKESRILTVEDTYELDIPHLNAVSYFISRNESNPSIGYAEMIDHLVRSRPDIIITGEVSVANAFPIVRILNTGHLGFMSTIHANTPTLALTSAIPQNIKMAGIDSSDIAELLYQVVDVVIQLHRFPDGKRKITDILFPKTRENMILN